MREPHEVPEEGAPLFGRNPVLELLRTGSRRVEEIAIISEGRGPALHELLALAKRQGVKISYRTRDQLTAMAGDIHHQGVVVRVAGASYASLGDLLEIPAGRGEPPFFLALDQVQDPRNLGAVLRTAEATGVHGVIVPKHHAAGLTGAAAKSAMGASRKKACGPSGPSRPGASCPGSWILPVPCASCWGARGRGFGPWWPRTATSS
jgi:23S rRNA (guanosine2251-2'-O)-methyltransferase